MMRLLIGAVAVGMVFTVGCGGEEVAQEQQSSALQQTSFSDAVAVSKAAASGVVSELRTLDDELVARAITPLAGGEGTIELAGSEPTKFVVPESPSLEKIHEILHESWRKIVDAELAQLTQEEQEYGCRCYIGSNPQIQVACYTPYCSWPAPYQYSGGIAGCGCPASQSYCSQRAAACGKTPYWFCRYYGGWVGWVGVCGWY